MKYRLIDVFNIEQLLFYGTLLSEGREVIKYLEFLVVIATKRFVFKLFMSSNIQTKSQHLRVS